MPPHSAVWGVAFPSRIARAIPLQRCGTGTGGLHFHFRTKAPCTGINSAVRRGMTFSLRTKESCHYYRVEGEGGVYTLPCMAGRSRMIIGPSHPYNAGDGARRVFTDLADTACTKREAP